MKLPVTLSLIIHGLFVLFMIHDSVKEKPKQEEQAKQNKGQYELQIEVLIPNTSGSEAKIIKKKKDFYWGIGISPDYEFRDMFGAEVFGYVVGKVYEGYCAYDAGVQVGDFIYLIDGQAMTEKNDIRGDGPRRMLLTIIRKNVTINLTVDRCKVYY